MKFVKTKYGDQLESIIDYKSIEFEDLVDENSDLVRLKKITLLMYSGLSPRAKSPFANQEYVEIIHPNIKWINEFAKPVELYQEMYGLTNFGGFEIIPSDVALYLLQDELNLNTEKCTNEYEYESIQEDVSEEVYSSKKYQKILMNEICSIIENIKKYETITDIVIGGNFLSFNIEIASSGSDYDMSTIAGLSNYWGMTDANIRMAIKNKKFDMSVVEKRMGTYLIPKYEMKRVFGDYAIYNFKKIKRELGYKKNKVAEHSLLIENCVRELSNISEPYGPMKLGMVMTLRDKDLDAEKEFLKSFIDIDNVHRINLTKLMELNDRLVYLSVFEKLITEQNKIEDEYAKECKDTYLSINLDIERSLLEYSKTNSRYANSEYEDYRRYVGELKFDIYGLSDRDMEYDDEGFKIGEVNTTFYNICKLADDGMFDELGIMMDLIDQPSEDLYYMLLENKEYEFFEDIGIANNILYVHNLTLKEEYNKPEVIKLIMRNMENDIDFLYDHRVGIICHPVFGSGMESRKYKNIFKSIGFQEMKNHSYSLLYFNTAYVMDDTPIRDDYSSDYDNGLDYLEIYDEIVVDDHTFYELAPRYDGDISRWVCKANGVVIEIQIKYNQFWAYEVYNPVGSRMRSMKYSIEDYSLMDICRIVIPFIPKVDVGIIGIREGSKVRVKVRCIEDYTNGDTQFVKGETYRAKDNGYELSVKMRYLGFIIAQDYEGKWERDEYFKKYFELV